MQSGLEIERETDGLITEISRDRCVVSVNINGARHTLSFGKSFLYTFGQQCDGDMTNILEEEMEVNVCYKYSQTLNKLSVIAVWVGEKPDLSNRDFQPLDEVYNQKGIVDIVRDDGSFVVRADGMDFHVVRLDVLYRDGCFLETDQCPVTIGDTVTFDAIPSGGKSSGAAYNVTCAWIGTEPRLADRFNLSVSNSSSQDLETLTKDCVYGVVIVIPNNAVAFVRVEDSGEKVLLFRSSLNRSSDRIEDVVKVGDSVCMRLSFCYIFPGCRQWFAAAACMDGEDISEVSRESVAQMRVSVSSGIQAGDLCSAATSEDNSEIIESADSDDSNDSRGGLPSEEIANVITGESIVLPPEVGTSATYEGSMLYNEPPLTGTLWAKTRSSGIITYGEFNILLRKENFFCEGKREKFKAMRQQKVLVKFEAYPLRQLSMNTLMTHEAACGWIGDKPTLSCVASNLNKGNYFLPENNILHGKVIGFYLPEVAFLATGKTNKPLVFCLHLTDLGQESRPEVFCKKSRNKFICDFLKIGQYVKFKVKRNSEFPLGMCGYGIEKSNKKAFRNFVLNLSVQKVMKKSQTARVDIDMGRLAIQSHRTPESMVSKDEDSYAGSWDSVWGSGEYFRTGVIEVVERNYVVKFVSSKVPNKEVRLDLSTAIKERRVFCNGKPIVSLPSKRSGRGEEPKLNTADSTLEGREISFHVGRKCSAVNVNDAEVIKCAWIGEYPELPTLLAGKTAAFSRLICEKWCYEGVIEGFPLPTHAICKVGTLDVHLPLTPIKRNGEMVGVVQSHLKMADRVLLKIKTEHFPTMKITCLTATICTSVKKLYDDQDVFRVAQGTIIDLPKPLGKIKMLGSSIEAKFDRSSVQAVNGVSRSSKIIYAWDHMVTKSIDVGVVVYFSAAKDLTLNSYRAYEVWIGNPP